MPPLVKTHPATLKDLHVWSTLSRNEIRPLLARFNIHPLGAKFPMERVYRCMLGVVPTNAFEEEMLGAGLIRVGRAAERFGMSSDTLLAKLRTPTTSSHRSTFSAQNATSCSARRWSKCWQAHGTSGMPSNHSRNTPCPCRAWPMISRFRNRGSTLC